MRRRGKTVGPRVAAGALVLGLALAGCGESAGSSSSGAAPAQRGAAAGGAANPGVAGNNPGAAGAAGANPGVAGAPNPGSPAAGATGAAKPGSKPQVSGHSVIFAGELQLRCDRVDDALGRAEAIVAGVGGYVDSESSGTDGMPVPSGGDGTAQPLPAPIETGGETAVIVFKVPTADYDSVYQQLEGLGTVLGRERSSTDVTAQVVDLASRIKTQQASIDRVNALMKQASSLNDIMTVEAALTQRESDLESMESQLAALQSQVAMSSVTVQLFEQAKPVVVVKPKPKPKSGAWDAAWNAMRAGWHGLYLVFRTVLVVVSALLPFLIVLVPVGALAWWLNRRRRKDGPGPRPEPAPGFAPPVPDAPHPQDADD